MFVQQLKNVNLERIDIDDAVALVTLGRAAEHGYAHYKVSAPAWLTDGIELLDGEIQRRRRDMLVARQKEISASLTQLQTREEKREALQAELAKLNDDLGIGKK